MVTPVIGPHVHIVADLALDLSPVLAEPTILAQILHNLSINAGQAMPDGGTLTISTSHVDSTDVPDDGGSRPVGTYARLTIRDTGHGMTPETLQRAVEPFFTTKGRGLGTGLGLATVYGIVNQLGGVLRISSRTDEGTTITIDLPTTDRRIEISVIASAPIGGAETILVAEDEDGIRDTLARTLSAAGYTVLTAVDGGTALTAAERHPGSIDLLLTDVVMPGMLGDELAERLLERRPAIKVLFMSGYAGDLMNRFGVLQTGVTVLPKPFSSTELLAAIRASVEAVPA
jgi:CheY-like chemotaxis protein